MIVILSGVWLKLWWLYGTSSSVRVISVSIWICLIRGWCSIVQLFFVIFGVKLRKRMVYKDDVICCDECVDDGDVGYIGVGAGYIWYLVVYGSIRCWWWLVDICICLGW